MLLRRKIDTFLDEWKANPDRLPLIVKGARQVGKTVSISAFAQRSYPHVIQINFALQKQFREIFDEGFEVDTIIRNIHYAILHYASLPIKRLFSLMSYRIV